MISVLVIKPDDSIDYDRKKIDAEVDKFITEYEPDTPKEIKYIDYNGLKTYGDCHRTIISALWRQLLNNESNLICVIRTKKTCDAFSLIADLGELEHLEMYSSNIVVHEVIDYEH